MPLKAGRWITQFIQEHGIKDVLEIGTLHGVGACYLGAAVAPAGGTVITVDVPDSKEKQPCAEQLVQELRLTNVTILRPENGAGQYLREQLFHGEKKFDLVYLDADHRFLPTIYFFALCAALVKPGGFILVDDMEHPEIPAGEEAWSVLLKMPGFERVECEIWNWGMLKRVA